MLGAGGGIIGFLCIFNGAKMLLNSLLMALRGFFGISGPQVLYAFGTGQKNEEA